MIKQCFANADRKINAHIKCLVLKGPVDEIWHI